MKCPNCDKEILTEYAAFCPFCGKKIKTKRTERGMKLIDYFKFMKDDELVQTMKDLSACSANEIRENLDSYTKPVFVFTPVFVYSYTDTDGHKWRNRRERTALSDLVNSYSEASGTKERAYGVDGNRITYYTYFNQCVEITKRKLTAQDDPSARGDYWFETYEECAEAVEKVIEGNNIPMEVR